MVQCLYFIEKSGLSGHFLTFEDAAGFKLLLPSSSDQTSDQRPTNKEGQKGRKGRWDRVGVVQKNSGEQH